jgi:hypothetical protein
MPGGDAKDGIDRVAVKSPSVLRAGEERLRVASILAAVQMTPELPDPLSSFGAAA